MLILELDAVGGKHGDKEMILRFFAVEVKMVNHGHAALAYQRLDCLGTDWPCRVLKHQLRLGVSSSAASGKGPQCERMLRRYR